MQPQVFMSYSHAADARLAPAVQRGLHRLGKRLFQLRAMRVFRDQTSLSATPELWPSIEEALAQSGYFILLASPEAAASRWVGREVEWWLANKSWKNLLIVVTEGSLEWDDAANDFAHTEDDPLPAELRGRFPSEPLWVDLTWARTDEQLTLRNSSFRSAILDLGSSIHKIPKDRLDGDDVRRQRVLRAVATGAFLAVLAAAVVATVQFFEARRQRDIAVAAQASEKAERLRAEHQRNIAQARALVSEGEAAFEERPLQALRTALEGLARAPTAEPELIDSLAGRVAAMARHGRLAKLSGDVKAVRSEPAFPHLLLVNRFGASPLFRKSDMKELAAYPGVNPRQPLAEVAGGRFFVVSFGPDDLELDYDLRRTRDGSRVGVGRDFEEGTLLSLEAPRFAALDRGNWHKVIRLADGREIKPPRVDVKDVYYQQGAPAFVLTYVDLDSDLSSEPRPLPQLVSVETGEVVEQFETEVGDAFFSTVPDDRHYLLSLPIDRGAELRHLDRRGTVLASLPGNVDAAAFGRVGEGVFLLACGGEGCWTMDVATGRVQPIGDADIAKLASASPREGWIATRNDDKRERVWLDGDALLTEPLDEPPPLLRTIGHADSAVKAATWNPSTDLFQVERRYENRDGDSDSEEDSDIVASEVRRKADGRLIYSDRKVVIEDLSGDPAGTLLTLDWYDVDDDSDFGSRVLGTDTTEVLWAGEQFRRAYFEPGAESRFVILDFTVARGQEGAESLIVSTSHPPDRVRGLGGDIQRIEFREADGLPYFVATLDDQTTSIWIGAPPRKLADLGTGIAGRLELPGARLLVWNEKGDAYLLDLRWLALMEGHVETLDAESLLETLCQVPFSSDRFDESAWRETFSGGEPHACPRPPG